MLSPFLFSLNIADCRSQSENTPIVQFADGTGLTGLLTMTTPSTGNRLETLMTVFKCHVDAVVKKVHSKVILFEKHQVL